MMAIEQYLYAESIDLRRAILSSIQHMIKSYGEDGDKLSCDLQLGKIPFDIATLDAEQLKKMAILAVYVEFGYNKAFGCNQHDSLLSIPEWLKHPKLYLDEPHFGRGTDFEYLYWCPQECLNHNVFIEVGSLSVI